MYDTLHFYFIFTCVILYYEIHFFSEIFVYTFYYVQQYSLLKMSKRNNDEGGSEEPPIKKVQFEPVRLGAISTMEDLDMKVLQYQNKKLAQVIFYKCK